jgi:class 3 adenylate cyclase
LIAAAATLSSVIYTVIRNGETNDFEAEVSEWRSMNCLSLHNLYPHRIISGLYLYPRQILNIGDEFISLSNHNIRAVFGTLQALSTSTTSLVKSQHNETGYPVGFVTIPDVEDQFMAARKTSGSLVISYMPQVKTSDYDLWIEYAEMHKAWIAESNQEMDEQAEITPFIWEYYESGEVQHGHRSLESCSARRHRRTLEEVKAPSNRLNGPFSPVWQMSPPPGVGDAGIINYNLVDRPVFGRAVNHIKKTRLPVFLDVCDQSAWFGVDSFKDILQTVVAYPVFSDFKPDSELAGVFTAIVPWTRFFDNNLVDGTVPIMLVVSNTCDEVFSFAVDGSKATFLAEEDLHDPDYEHLFVSGPFADSFNPSEGMQGEHCVYTMKVYPTKSFEASYTTNEPLLYSLAILAIFFITSLFFLGYDWLVQKRQNELVTTARQQNAIVSSLFPKSIQQKLMKESSKGDQATKAANDRKAGKANLRTFLTSDDHAHKQEGDGGGESDPIADLFPETTVMFADISGFTAWSSAREPSQVFTLLESVYHSFDAIAKRRHVFKVEVVGDCYVAVCGLPDPRPDHALVMAKFAKDCMNKMNDVVHKLEVKLGPDTAELKLRVGLHSGPVVAGVLRGERSRFQLFGDTMNTARYVGLPGELIYLTKD